MSAVHDTDGHTETGPLAAHLGDLAGHIAVESIDQLWIFPTRRVAGAFSTVIVASTYDSDGPDRRRIFTAHYTVRVDRRGRLSTHASILEHGAAPADRLARLIEGVLRRLDEELLADPPREVRIEGSAEAWQALLESESSAPSSSSGTLASRDLFSD